MVDVTVEHDLGEDSGIVALRCNVVVDDDATPENAAIAVAAAKATMQQAQWFAEAYNSRPAVPDDLSELSE